jgi:long-chain acyl-CoA synthetase
MKKIFITGATGMIGGEIALRLAATCEVSCLTRGGSQEEAQKRLDLRLKKSLLFRDLGIKAVLGDLHQEGLGVAGDYDIDVIVHAAAETAFNDADSCRLTNIEGTKRVIEFAKRCKNPPLLCYISTACNVGAVTNTCLKEEDGCRLDNEHHNEYTKSKAISETLIRNSGLPFLIIRPPIVLSDSVKDRGFARQIFWFAPIVFKFKAVPVSPTSRLDIIPVSYLVEYIDKLLALPERKYDCYNISAGEKDCFTSFEWVEAIRKFNKASYAPKLIPPAEWTKDDYKKYVNTPDLAKSFRSLQYYFPFMTMDVVFNNARLQEEFGVLKVPPLHTYVDTILAQVSEEEALEESQAP